MRLPDAAPIPPNARHVTGRKRALETRRPFGREPGAFFVSSCVVVITRKLTYGNFVAIPAIAENKNTRRYWEDFWLPFLDTYRTMCLAPQPAFKRVLEDVRAMQLAA